MARRTKQKRKAREARERAMKEAARRRQLKLAAAVGIVAVLVAGIGYLIVNRPGSGNPGSLAPDFTLVDSVGNTFSLSQFRGKPVVLFFMTTADWCQPCKVETRDHLRPLYDTYGSRIQIISIEMLSEYSNADLNAYKSTYGTPWIYAKDTAGVTRSFGVTSLSTIVVVEQAGRIAFGPDPDTPYSRLVSVMQSLGV